MSLYRVTQGLRVLSGVVAVPLLLAKLWTVYPKLFAKLPGPKDIRLILERLSILVLVSALARLYGAALLLTTPTYPWHGDPLIALAALVGRVEWIAVPLASYLAYASFGHEVRQGVIHLTAALIVLTTLCLRRRLGPGGEGC